MFYRKLERDIIHHANDVLRLVKSGNKNLVFSDIIKTYHDLCLELQV